MDKVEWNDGSQTAFSHTAMLLALLVPIVNHGQSRLKLDIFLDYILAIAFSYCQRCWIHTYIAQFFSPNSLCIPDSLECVGSSKIVYTYKQKGPAPSFLLVGPRKL